MAESTPGPATPVAFQLLGPVRVLAGDQPSAIRTPRQSAVLAVLLAAAGRLTPADDLIDCVWGLTPPRHARRTLHTYLTRARRLLEQAGSVRLRHTGGGYLLEVDADRIDLHLFRRLVTRAGDVAGPARARLLRQALDLWQGDALTGVAGDWAERMRASWAQERIAAVTAWARAEREAGNASAVIAPLTALLGEHPLVETLSAELIRALHATGRSAEALDHFAAIRRRLCDELGADPGTELQGLHRAILRETTPPAVPSRPAQLPPDVRGFAGRAAALAALDRLLPGDQADTAVGIAVITGGAGVGKTTLAVHWAHLVAARFPDGQLYARLRGFGPGAAAMNPAEALRGFFDAFGVPAGRIPQGYDGQIDLYRSMLAGRRVLVVLDDARDAEQVRPLLPGAAGSAVVVTSRNRLTGLVAVEGADAVHLDPLSLDEAQQMLTSRLGPPRTRAEPEAVDRIAGLCVRLPLALAVVAARAITLPWLRLSALADELHATRGSLEGFDGGEGSHGGDPASNVRAVFATSYAALSPAAARLFRMIGLHPAPEVSAAAFASLAGEPVGQVRPALSGLTTVHLIAEPAPERFGAHDLLRAYAAELAATTDTGADRRAALHRLLDHYLHTARTADILLHPHGDRVPAAPCRPGVTVPDLQSREAAFDWFAADLPALVAAADLAARSGFDQHAWRLCAALRRYVEFRRDWRTVEPLVDSVGAAVDRLADPLDRANGHLALALAADRLTGGAGLRHFQAAIDAFETAGSRLDQAIACRRMAASYERANRLDLALDLALRALDLYRGAGDPNGEAVGLNAAGWYLSLNGQHQAAVTHCRDALDRHLSTGNRLGAAATLDTLGHAHHHLGHHRSAVECLNRAIDLYRQIGDRDGEAETLNHLGDTQLALGDHEAARASRAMAGELLDDLGRTPGF